MSPPERGTRTHVQVLLSGGINAAATAFSVITFIGCAFTATPALFDVLRDHPTPFTPNEYVLGAFIAFMYIMPVLLYLCSNRLFIFSSTPSHLTVGARWAVSFSTFAISVWSILWVKEKFKAAAAVQFLVVFGLLYANAVLLRRKPFGPLVESEHKIVHLPIRFFLVLSLNVLIGLSVYMAISSHGPQPIPTPNPSPTTSLSTTFLPSTTFSEPITVTLSESTTDHLPLPTTTVESQTVEPFPTTTVDESTTTGEDTPTTTGEEGPSTTLEPTETTSDEGSPSTTLEPTASTTEEDIPTTTDSPTVTIGPGPSTTEEEAPSTTEETTTAEETQSEVTVTHTAAPTPLPPSPENPNPQQNFSGKPDQQEMPEPIKAAARQPAIAFLVLINILELIITFWRGDISMSLAATWIAFGLWTAGPMNSAAKEMSIVGMVFTVLHPLAFGLSRFLVQRKQKGVALAGPENPLTVPPTTSAA